MSNFTTDDTVMDSSLHTRDEVMIQLKRLFENINIPQYATEGSAGMDIEANEEIIISPMSYAAVGTGIAVAIPRGYEIQLRPRSGLALKYGITLLNSPATIDSDYRGEVRVLLVNFGQKDFSVVRGMRIAQMVIAKVTTGTIVLVNELCATERNDGGFGSTGLFSSKANNGGQSD